MNKILKKTLSIILVIIMIVTSVPFAFAADLYGGGWCGANGNNLIWKVYSDGTLEISGTGKMADYEEEVNTAPWYTQYGDFITCVVIEDGAENIGERAFKDLVNLTSISIPASVTSVEAYAFEGCSFLFDVFYAGNKDNLTIYSLGNEILIDRVYYPSKHIYHFGDIIQWGSYPQTKVADESLIAKLNEAAPVWDNWTSYGYYTGAGVNSYGTMTQGDWMRYIDITYDGEKYRGVRFTYNRPRSNLASLGSLGSDQSVNEYHINTNYWFRFEPICWRVLDLATGLIMCETIIDSQPYSNTIYENSSVDDSRLRYFNDASYTNYANDYETSSIRKWLNEDFYNTAFTDSEKKEINTTTLNSDSNSTNDKIFLLSYDEVINSNFGFDSNQSEDDEARRAKGSDYAKSQGLRVFEHFSPVYINDNSFWLLRSPGWRSNTCCGVDGGGGVEGDFCVDYSFVGVRPALSLNLASANPCNKLVQSEAKAPTCTEIGWAAYEYCRSCGYTTYAEIPATGHDWSNKDGICAKDCGETCPHENYTDRFCDNCGYECPHENYTDCVCDNCGYECPHDSYTDGICDNCEYVCPHSWEGVLTSPVHNAVLGSTDGYYTYTCSICGDSYTEVVKGADYSAYDDISDIINGYLSSDELTTEARQEIYSAILEFGKNNENVSDSGTLPDNLMASEQTIVNEVVAELQKIVDVAEEKMASGEYVKADCTEIDKRIAEIEKKLADENVTDEGKARFVEMKAQFEKLKAEGNMSKAKLDLLEIALTYYEAALDEGIEDGTAVKADYTEIDEAITSVDEALANATISEEMANELAEIKEQLETLKENEGATMADVNELLERVNAVAETMADCAKGVHSFTAYTEAQAPECGKAGKEVAFCDNGCGATDENEIPALTHKDTDGDYLCDNGCGHEFEQFVTPDEPTDDTCDRCGEVHTNFFQNFICMIRDFFNRIINFFTGLF